MDDRTAFGATITARIDELARTSAAAGEVTRLYLTPEHRQAADLILGWMRDAGMSAHLDAVGNVCGRYEGATPGLPALLLGSHFDTVRNAGKWDGPLGLITAIACVERLHRHGKRPQFAIEVIGFADEEGVRFPLALTGSRAVAGTLGTDCLDARDASGISLRDALGDFGLDPARLADAARRRGDFHAYVELHIEQGPVLQSEALAMGVVTAISGATRLRAELDGFAGHAGTVPMDLRRDALAGAAECILAIEHYCRNAQAMVGTVGQIAVSPGAVNVVPGRTSFTIDVRTPQDERRLQAVAEIAARIEAIAESRKLTARIASTYDSATVWCAPWLRGQIAQAIGGTGHRVLELPSGAGHDGVAMHEIADIAMIFVRCRDGISHNPTEHVDTADVASGADVLMRFIEHFRPQH